MTQNERIMKYIHDFGSITPMQAIYDLGCTKLATRISELIAGGERIRKETVSDQNRYGERCHYTRYSREA